MNMKEWKIGAAEQIRKWIILPKTLMNLKLFMNNEFFSRAATLCHYQIFSHSFFFSIFFHTMTTFFPISSSMYIALIILCLEITFESGARYLIKLLNPIFSVSETGNRSFTMHWTMRTSRPSWVALDLRRREVRVVWEADVSLETPCFFFKWFMMVLLDHALVVFNFLSHIPHTR